MFAVATPCGRFPRQRRHGHPPPNRSPSSTTSPSRHNNARGDLGRSRAPGGAIAGGEVREDSAAVQRELGSGGCAAKNWFELGLRTQVHEQRPHGVDSEHRILETPATDSYARCLLGCRKCVRGVGDTRSPPRILFMSSEGWPPGEPMESSRRRFRREVRLSSTSTARPESWHSARTKACNAVCTRSTALLPLCGKQCVSSESARSTSPETSVPLRAT